eukprot:scaffold128144_cov19-Tisochrysis_lutea.AAC.1
MHIAHAIRMCVLCEHSVGTRYTKVCTHCKQGWHRAPVPFLEHARSSFYLAWTAQIWPQRAHTLRKTVISIIVCDCGCGMGTSGHHQLPTSSSTATSPFLISPPFTFTTATAGQGQTLPRYQPQIEGKLPFMT